MEETEAEAQPFFCLDRKREAMYPDLWLLRPGVPGTILTLTEKIQTYRSAINTALSHLPQKIASFRAPQCCSFLAPAPGLLEIGLPLQDSNDDQHRMKECG